MSEKDLQTTFKYKDKKIIFFVHPEHKKKRKNALLDLISSQIYNRDKFYEQVDLEASMRYLKKGDVVIDCGANIGNHSIFWSKVCGCKVIAIEPFDKNWRLLKKNSEVNNCDIDICKVILSDKNRKFKCFSPKRNIGATTYEEDVNGESESKALDSFIDSTLDIKIIKIDVEGEELNVIKGAAEIINRCHPILLVEIHPYIYDPKEGKKMLPKNKQRVLNLLESLGYEEEYEIDSRYVFKYRRANE